MSLVWCVAHFFFEFAARFACGYGLVRSSKCRDASKIIAQPSAQQPPTAQPPITTSSSELHNTFDAEGNIVLRKAFLYAGF